MTAPKSARASARFPVGELAAVALGGATGATARYGALQIWPVVPGAFPTTVLIVNLLASAMLGLALAVLDERHGSVPDKPVVRGLLVAGVIGGFGTLSLVAVDTARLCFGAQVATGVLYAAATLVGCTAVLLAGLVTGGWRPRWHTMPEEDEL